MYINIVVQTIDRFVQIEFYLNGSNFKKLHQGLLPLNFSKKENRKTDATLLSIPFKATICFFLNKKL